MVIVIEDGGIHMDDPSDFKAFKVVVKPGEDPAAVAAVGRLADPATAWIDVDAVRNLAGAAATIPGWEDGFAAMLAFARTKGWLDESGSAVQAHIEHEDA
jgi:hypothetical protein